MPLNVFGFFNGAYEDFSLQWYKEVGAVICYAQFLESFTPHTQLFIEYLIKEVLRFLDRG